MASWREIDRVRKDPGAFKSLANEILARRDQQLCNLSEFAEDFLHGISRWRGPELSSRQGEVLLGLRDETAMHFDIRGLSVRTLIERCFQVRFELDLSDRERVEDLNNSGRSYVTGRQIGWFKRICRELGEIEGYM
jgi:hypothetical protein